MPSQMQELVARVHAGLDEPWNKPVGRPKSCGLYRATEIACMYLRHNVTQEFLGDMRDVSQPTVFRYVTDLIPVVEAVLEEFVPSAAEAIEMVNGRVCLVDGTITPCWSYADHEELWSRKHGTTGFNAQLVCLLEARRFMFLIRFPGILTTRLPSATLRWRRSSAPRAAELATRAIRDVTASPLRARSRGAVSSASGTKNATPKSPRCELLSSESLHISNLGESFTPTIAARTAPIATRTTPPEDCSSSHSFGV
jgi:hypothetical protein